MYQPTELPQPLADVLDAVRSFTSDEARFLLAEAGPEQRAAWVSGLQQLSDAVAAASITATEAFDRNGDGETLHAAASTQAWLRGALRIPSGEAAERVRLGRQSRDVLTPAVQSMRDGRLTHHHLCAIDRSLRHVPTPLQAEAAGLLTGLAEQATVAAVRHAGQHLADTLNPDGTLASREQQFERRHLTLAPMLDGMTALDGLLDAESAALLSAALEPFLTPLGPDDHRSAAQRRADGLVELVQSAADHRLIPVSGGERPHLRVAVKPGAAVGSCCGQLAASLVVAPGGAQTLHPMSAARIACDCQITALLLDEQGVVTNLGRTRRLFSASQRKLLSQRDGGCRWPDCARPPGHTDAHHVLSWLDGGASDVANAVLLCRFHHRSVHEGGWKMRVVDPSRGTHGTVAITGPSGQRLSSDPRGP